MNQMTAVQISRPGAAFEVIKRDLPEPGRSHVRIKVQACGVCHSDVFVKEGHWPGLEYPRITGHEVAGVIDEIGSEVTAWRKGQRVGVGWHGAHCGVCVPCRRGDFISCQNLRITGFNNDGGYAQYMIARADVLALIPEALSPVEAAPILCAGITTFNSLRHSGAVAGDLVAVLGLGGLGHLGIQFANKMGYRTVAMVRRSFSRRRPIAKPCRISLTVLVSAANCLWWEPLPIQSTSHRFNSSADAVRSKAGRPEPRETQKRP